MVHTKVTRIITAGGMAFALALFPIAVNAQTVTPNPTQAARQADRLTTLHTLADNAISIRLTSLSSASTRINSLVKLSDDQKSKYNGEITTDVNALNSLKTKVDGDTDLTTLKNDYHSIFTTYRIYAEFLPQLHLLAASDTMDVTADKLNDLYTKLQGRVNAAGNPSNLTSLLSDMQAKISDAKTQYGAVQSQITPLTPQSWDNDPTGTRNTLQNARNEIKTGATDLKTALSDAKQIIQTLKTTATPTPTP